MLVLALSCPLTVKEKFFTCWAAGMELVPAFFRSPVILGIPAMALKTKQYEGEDTLAYLRRDWSV